jgi:hypothetical protein
MRSMHVCVLLGLGAACARAQDFTPLFNGKDLGGWVVVNGAPSTWRVEGDRIVTTGKPIGILRTTRMYENFILELEWSHQTEGGNSGLFIHSDPLPVRGSPFTRAMEIQVMLGDDPNGRYTRHGDVFAIQGATFTPDRPHPAGWMRCLPSENRVKGAGEWNHYRVESRDGRVTLAVNGKVVSGGTKCIPRKGFICLEAEGSECHFRNLKIQELPSSNPPAAETASPDEGFVTLYTGMDLSGWKDEGDGHWKPAQWGLLDYDGKGKDLWTQREFGDFVLIADWKLPRKPAEKELAVILPDGTDTGRKEKVQDAGDSGIYLRGSQKAQVNITCKSIGSGEVYGYRADASMPAEVRRGATPKMKADQPPGQWNRFVITMKGDRLTVELNGKIVIDNAQLPGVPPRGPIALQHHGDPVQFANLFIRELK